MQWNATKKESMTEVSMKIIVKSVLNTSKFPQNKVLVTAAFTNTIS